MVSCQVGYSRCPKSLSLEQIALPGAHAACVSIDETLLAAWQNGEHLMLMRYRDPLATLLLHLRIQLEFQI